MRTIKDRKCVRCNADKGIHRLFDGKHYCFDCYVLSHKPRRIGKTKEMEVMKNEI